MAYAECEVRLQKKCRQEEKSRTLAGGREWATGIQSVYIPIKSDSITITFPAEYVVEEVSALCTRLEAGIRLKPGDYP